MDQADHSTRRRDSAEPSLTGALGEPPPTASSPAPVQVGRYLVHGVLGRGGMGVVYRGHDPTLDRPVAIKAVAPSLAADPEALRMLEREARILASISHPNVATIIALETLDDRPHVVLEFLDGPTLHQHLSKKAPPVPEALSIAAQVAAGLHAAHERGVIHLDLKPANIKLGSGGAWKVLDFGLSRHVARASDSASPSGVDSIDGTPGYMSPEQVRGLATDQRADAWAFGCVLFTCLTGRPAFDGPTADDRITATLNAEPDWDALPSDTPPRVIHLVHACLVKDPAQRLSSLAVAHRELQRAIDGEGEEGPSGGIAARHASNNIPAQVSTFIGREADVAAVARLLDEGRLVTVTGPGGVGKTRLSLEVARHELGRREHGAWFVELAALAHGEHVPSQVARALGLKEVPGIALEAALDSFVAEREMLLILDNCEHLLDATAALVARLLSLAPRLSVLTTARELLGLQGEQAWALAPLQLQDGDIIDVDAAPAAVRLFVERARLAQPTFALTAGNARSVASLCRRLDGMPLALELAAARMRTFSLPELQDRLADRFRLLTGGSRSAMRRHQTLRATLDWSHDLLAEPERLLLRRLAVFADGFTLELAERTCGDESLPAAEVLDVLSHLIDKSLVQVKVGGNETRYQLLETTREFALEKLLAAAEGDAVRARLLDALLVLAEMAAPHLAGREQSGWLDRLEQENENFRAGLDASQGSPATHERGARLAIALWRYWELRGRWSEASQRFAALLTNPDRLAPSTRASLLGVASWIAYQQGRHADGKTLAIDSLAIIDTMTLPKLRAIPLTTLGSIAMREGDLAGASRWYAECLALQREIGTATHVADALSNLGAVSLHGGNFAEARALIEEGLALRREVGDRNGTAQSLNHLGAIAQASGDLPRARTLLEESLALRRQLRSRIGLAYSLANLGVVLQEMGDHAGARALHEEGLALRREMGDRAGMSQSLLSLAWIACREGQFADARPLLSESLILGSGRSHRLVIVGILTAADLLVRTGEARAAARLVGAAEAHHARLGFAWTPMERRPLDDVREIAHAQLGADEFAREAAIGGALSMDAAIEFTCGLLTPR